MARQQLGAKASYTPPRGMDPRVFFECGECGYFHESRLLVDCRLLTNRFLLGHIPVGGLTGTEVHYLDGHIERVGPDGS